MQLAIELPDRTNALIESYSQKMGLEKNSFIEDALLRHLQALRELPTEFIIPTKITVTEDCMKQIIEMLENPPEPTQALIELMR